MPGATPTLKREKLIDECTLIQTGAGCRPTRPESCGLSYFTGWTSEVGEQGFTLDPGMFNPARPSSFHFGTRKIGDPQFRGRGNDLLASDVYNDRTPEALTILLRRWTARSVRPGVSILAADAEERR